MTKDGNPYTDGTGDAFAFTPDDNGDYVVTLTATDDDGGVGVTGQHITVTNVAPTADAGDDFAVDEGSAASFFAGWSDPGAADTLTYVWHVVAPNGQVVADGTDEEFSFVPADDGDYAVTLTVTDDDGASDSKTVAVTAHNVAPTATITGAPAQSPEGTEVVLGSTASDPAGAKDPLTYAWSVTKNGNPYAVSGPADGPGFRFTPDDNGTYVVRLRVDDGDGGTVTTSETMDVTNVAPLGVTLGDNFAVSEGQAVGLSTTFTDPGAADTHTVHWHVVSSNGQVIADADGGSFGFVPNDNGTYTVTVTVADDDGGAASDTVVVTSDNVRPAVATTGTPAGTVPEGSPVTLGSVVTDPGSADTHTYAWSVTRNGQSYALPAGTAAGGANFAFTPTDDGTYVVTLVVTDDDGATGTTTATVAVANANPTASIAGAPASSLEGTAIVLTGAAADAGAADTQTFAWSVTKDGAPYAGGAGAAFAFTPDDNGVYVVTLTATDDDGGVGTDVRAITVGNVAPNGSILGAPASAPEGAAIDLSASASDAGSADALYYAWTVTKDGAAYGSGTGPAFTFVPNDNGTYALTLVVTDDDGASSADQRIVAVTNVAPSVALVGPSADYVAAAGAVVPFRGTFSDPGSADTFTATWTFTPATGAPIVVTRSVTGGVANLDYVFAAAGVYHVRLVVTDDDGGAGTAEQVGGFDATVVVYDPTAGYVAGNGHIDSPAGAYVDDPSWSGKASFHFLSQYEKGKTVPTGDTVFSFKMDARNGFEFVSTAYEWMVISGSRVQYKGTGSVNGVAGYRFILTAVDGDVDGTKQDKFRIRIWQPAALGGGVVYDNQMGTGADAAPATVIAGGSINIKREKNAGNVLP